MFDWHKHKTVDLRTRSAKVVTGVARVLKWCGWLLIAVLVVAMVTFSLYREYLIWYK